MDYNELEGEVFRRKRFKLRTMDWDGNGQGETKTMEDIMDRAVNERRKT